MVGFTGKASGPPPLTVSRTVKPLPGGEPQVTIGHRPLQEVQGFCAPAGIGLEMSEEARRMQRPSGRRPVHVSPEAIGMTEDTDGYSESSTTSIAFTQAIFMTGTKVRRILPWALGRIPEKVRSTGRPSPPASLMMSKFLIRATPLQ